MGNLIPSDRNSLSGVFVTDEHHPGQYRMGDGNTLGSISFKLISVPLWAQQQEAGQLRVGASVHVR